MESFLADNSERERFRVEHALHAVEDALRLLEPAPADGIEISALERVRDDLSVLLRAVKAA
jgi:hypothetical protein